MTTSSKAGFTQIFSCCPKNLSCPIFWGAAAPLAPPPGPYAYGLDLKVNFHHEHFIDPTNCPWVSEDGRCLKFENKN